ncbi:unnamed protein product [Parnassius apollo]|uniref:(apollo) hypothetical protein n=1 Tax=Parnassius apollo TaxID=110799 RepID=A0A8S3XFR9_PARAO|nr:unnamed protein product [Parnassius apollo]
MRWSQIMNKNALRAYFRAKGDETGCLAYRARVHRFFGELEKSHDREHQTAGRKRIEDRIAKARALIGRLTSFKSDNNRPRVERTVRMAFAGINISLSQPDITQKLTERIDDLKQKIAAWGKRFNQNRLFQIDQKRLNKSLERLEVCGAGPGLNQADTVAFWRGL